MIVIQIKGAWVGIMQMPDGAHLQIINLHKDDDAADRVEEFTCKQGRVFKTDITPNAHAARHGFPK